MLTAVILDSLFIQLCKLRRVFSPSADNTLLDMYNSSDYKKANSIISKYSFFFLFFFLLKLYLLNIMVQLTLTLVVTLCCFLAISECLIKDKEKYQSDEEERFPYTIWIDNRKMIERHNSDKNSTFKMEMNQFGDMVLFLKWLSKPAF